MLFTALKASLSTWNKATNERVKLQYVYAVTGIALLVVSGLVSLINDQLGFQLLSVTFTIAAVFFINVVVWALFDSIILSKLPKNPSRKR